MRTTINIEEIKKKIDYQSLSQEIATLSQNGGLQRQNPIAELLNPVKDALLAARQNKATIPSLVKFFQQKGLPISEASLRRYLHEQTNALKSRSTTRRHAHRTNHAVPSKHTHLAVTTPTATNNRETA